MNPLSNWMSSSKMRIWHGYRPSTGHFTISERTVFFIEAKKRFKIDTITKTQYIHAYEGAVPAFSYTISNNTVYFTNESPGQYLHVTWYFGEHDSTNVANPFYVLDSTGILTVTLAAIHVHCGPFTTTQTIATVGLEHHNRTGNVVFTPNPSSGIYYLAPVNIYGKIKIYLFDIYGRNVFVDTWQNNSPAPHRIDLQNLPPGTYFYLLKSQAGDVSGKLIKR
ncbi:MAG TPA: T9SS type A sorting domain-containing protein [Bacteroidetes bacterium]|nr:T9SS type A sorting domain-containing protein [Bacteroidota bacterium]